MRLAWSSAAAACTRDAGQNTAVARRERRTADRRVPRTGRRAAGRRAAAERRAERVAFQRCRRPRSIGSRTLFGASWTTSPGIAGWTERRHACPAAPRPDAGRSPRARAGRGWRRRGRSRWLRPRAAARCRRRAAASPMPRAIWSAIDPGSSGEGDAVGDLEHRRGDLGGLLDGAVLGLEAHARLAPPRRLRLRALFRLADAQRRDRHEYGRATGGAHLDEDRRRAQARQAGIGVRQEPAAGEGQRRERRHHRSARHDQGRGDHRRGHHQWRNRLRQRLEIGRIGDAGQRQHRQLGREGSDQERLDRRRENDRRGNQQGRAGEQHRDTAVQIQRQLDLRGEGDQRQSDQRQRNRPQRRTRWRRHRHRRDGRGHRLERHRTRHIADHRCRRGRGVRLQACDSSVTGHARRVVGCEERAMDVRRPGDPGARRSRPKDCEINAPRRFRGTAERHLHSPGAVLLTPCPALCAVTFHAIRVAILTLRTRPATKEQPLTWSGEARKGSDVSLQQRLQR